MKPIEMTDNENTMTELSIAPDGRVFVFGTSRPVLELLEALQPNDAKLCRLLQHVRALESTATAQMGPPAQRSRP